MMYFVFTRTVNFKVLPVGLQINQVMYPVTQFYDFSWEVLSSDGVRLTHMVECCLNIFPSINIMSFNSW